MSGELSTYDAGLLGDGGGGDVDWWQDYMRAELARAHEFYADQLTGAAPSPATFASETNKDRSGKHGSEVA